MSNDKKAAKTAPKATNKKVAAKKVAAKKVNGKAAKLVPVAFRKRDFNSVIRLTTTPCTMRGKRAQTFSKIKDGMTVQALQTAMARNFSTTDWWRRTWQVLDAAQAKGFITLQ